LGRVQFMFATTPSVIQFVQREYEKWKLIVRESGATPE